MWRRFPSKYPRIQTELRLRYLFNYDWLLRVPPHFAHSHGLRGVRDFYGKEEHWCLARRGMYYEWRGKRQSLIYKCLTSHNASVETLWITQYIRGYFLTWNKLFLPLEINKSIRTVRCSWAVAARITPPCFLPNESLQREWDYNQRGYKGTLYFTQWWMMGLTVFPSNCIFSDCGLSFFTCLIWGINIEYRETWSPSRRFFLLHSKLCVFFFFVYEHRKVSTGATSFQDLTCV